MTQYRAKFATAADNNFIGPHKGQPVEKVNLLTPTGPTAHLKLNEGREMGWAIWVWGPDGNFYSHIAKYQRFHHSTFFAGEQVKAAGEWKVVRGKIEGICGMSGHYRPDFDALVSAIEELKELNVMNDGIDVLLWENRDGHALLRQRWGEIRNRLGFYKQNYKCFRG